MRKYDREFKEEAVKLSDEIGVKQATAQLGMAAVLDCYNGEIVGLAMDDSMKKELCLRAFRSACQVQGAYGMILHTATEAASLPAQAFKRSWLGITRPRA